MVNETRRPVPRARVRRIALRAGRLLRFSPNSRVTLITVTDRTIQAFNRRLRGENRPTDVLSFPLGSGRTPASLRRSLRADPDGWVRLGDVMISLDTAARQAAERSAGLSQEVSVLFAHGLLHLVGYDHERPREAERMSALARKLLS